MKVLILVLLIFVVNVWGRHRLPPILLQEQLLFDDEDCLGEVVFRHISLSMNCTDPELNADTCVCGSMYRCTDTFDEVFAMPNYVATKITDTVECRESDIWRDVVGFVEGCHTMYMGGEAIGSFNHLCISGRQSQMAYMTPNCTGEMSVDNIFGAIDTFDECIPTIHSGKWKKTHCASL